MQAEQKEKFFKAVLTKQLQKLLRQNEYTPESLSILKDMSPDFTDQASLESDIDLTAHMKERNQKLIIKINEALERLKEGTYGICEDCGEEISEQRLRARPITTLCIDCKRRQEAHEKARGI